ncbi:MAG TPA: Ig-like domain-containing protein, partial [Bryobacteraceae bacterium]|nr:Ig-like domain-containing protein [Bryobacteraceae bacterium]
MRLRLIQAIALLCLSSGLAFGQLSGITLSTSPNPSVVNNNVTMTASLNPPAAGVTIEFDDVTVTPFTNLGTAATNASGVATIFVSSLSVGTHRIRAQYNTGNVIVVSNTVSQVVNNPPPPSLSLTSNPNPSNVGQ